MSCPNDSAGFRHLNPISEKKPLSFFCRNYSRQLSILKNLEPDIFRATLYNKNVVDKLEPGKIKNN